MTRTATGALAAAPERGAGASRALAIAIVAGLPAGATAQLLGYAGGAPWYLGAGMAFWVTLGFLVTRRTAQVWAGRDRTAWACVVMAAYLFTWLLAYHVLYALLEHAPAVVVWDETRLWVAAVAPACAVLGVAATLSLRQGLAGDVCMALPLGWSLPEVVLAVQHGWSSALVAGLPTLLAGMAPLYVARTRRRRWSTVIVVALAGGLVLYVLFSPIQVIMSG